MDQSRERPVIRAVLAVSALMLLWMGRWIALGKVPTTGDLLRADYPFRDFYSRALSEHHAFDWMPGLLGGFDFTGATQNGGYHPVHWLLYRLLPLDTAFGIELLLPYPLAYAGMWLFLRLWCSPAGSAVGALLFASSGFGLLHVVHVNIVTIIAHLPLLLWSIHHAAAAHDWRARARWSAAIAALTGSQLLLDHPPAIWLSGLLEAFYLVYLLAAGPPATERAPGTRAALTRARALMTVAGGKLLGLTIGALQVIATYHATLFSPRAGSGDDFANQHAMPVGYLLQLINPYVSWGTVVRWSDEADADEYAVYAGAVTLMTVVWWVAGVPARRARGELTGADRFALWCLPVALLGLWLATGVKGGLYTLHTLLPIVRHFRVPTRFVLFVHVALICAAAVGFTRLARSTRGDPGARSGTIAAWVVAAVSVGITVVLRLVPTTSIPETDSLAAVALAPLVFVIVATLITFAARGSRAALIALVAAAAVDQAVYGLAGVSAWHDFATRAEIVEDLAEKAPLPPPGEHRLSCCQFPNVYTIAGYRVIEGYVGLMPVRRLQYDSNPTLRLAGVEFVHRTTLRKSRIRTAEAISSEWYRLPPALPRARLLTEAQVSTDPDEDVETLDIERAALVRHPVHLARGEPGIATIVRDDPGVIHVDTRTSGPQLLVVSEMFEEDWTVTIDGVPARVEQVNGDFLGCVVPAGMHTAGFEFRPRYREIGGPISLAGVTVMVVLAAAGCSRPRAARRAPAARQAQPLQQ